jgi:hypothetical protein
MNTPVSTAHSSQHCDAVFFSIDTGARILYGPICLHALRLLYQCTNNILFSNIRQLGGIVTAYKYTNEESYASLNQRRESNRESNWM